MEQTEITSLTCLQKIIAKYNELMANSRYKRCTILFGIDGKYHVAIALDALNINKLDKNIPVITIGGLDLVIIRKIEFDHILSMLVKTGSPVAVTSI